MKRWKPMLLWMLVLLLTGSACQLFDQITNPSTPEVIPHGTYRPETLVPGSPVVDTLTSAIPVETQVAATLTALAPTLSVEPGTPGATSPAPPSPTLAAAPALVAYAKEGIVYLWQEGTARQLTSPGSAVFNVVLSDDGQWLAYTRQVDELRQELWAVRTDSAARDGNRLMSNTDFAAIDPAALAVLPHQVGWVPGTHTLAFNTYQIFEGPGNVPYDDLHLINADTFERRTPLLAGEGGDFYFAPDGAQIALSTPTRVDLVNIDGSNRRSAVLTFEMVLTFSEYMLYPMLVWEADSSAVWAAIPPHDAMALPAQPSTIWRVPADGSPAVKTSEFNAVPLIGFELPISPDTQRVAYLAEIGEQPDTRLELHLLALDGSTDEIIHSAPFMDFLSWSPDGRHYAVSVGVDQALYLGEVGGSFAPAPDAQVGVASLDWLDEDRFVYVQTSDSGATLFSGSLSAAPQGIDRVSEGFMAFSVP